MRMGAEIYQNLKKVVKKKYGIDGKLITSLWEHGGVVICASDFQPEGRVGGSSLVSAVVLFP